MSVRRLYSILAVASLALAFGPAPAKAQTLTPADPPPSVQSNAEQPRWRVQCSTVLCEMVYELAPGDEQSPSRVLIYDVGDLTILEYTVPLGVGLGPGIVVQIDGQHNFSTEMLVCRASGCLGYLPLNERIIGLMKAGAQFALAFQNYADKEYYAYNYSLMGFTAAYELYLEGKTQIN